MQGIEPWTTRLRVVRSTGLSYIGNLLQLWKNKILNLSFVVDTQVKKLSLTLFPQLLASLFCSYNTNVWLAEAERLLLCFK
jgi:hypothetical protein